jgi:hypothetical protein
MAWDTNIVTLVKLLNSRNRADWDTVGAVTGDEGVGKTDLLIVLGLLANGLTIDRIYDPTKEDMVLIDKFFRGNMLYTQNATEIERVIENTPQYEFIGVDEGMMVLYKYEHGSKRQIELKKYFATCRKGHNNAVFFCMQDFLDFTKFFRDRRIRVWIHVVERGKAIRMNRSGNPVASDKWNIDKFSDIFDESKEDFNALCHNLESKSFPNYRGPIFWKKLPASIRNLYDKVREEIRAQYCVDDDIDPVDEDSERCKRWREKFLNIAKYMMTTYDLNQTDLGKIVGVSSQVFGRYLKGERE